MNTKKEYQPKEWFVVAIIILLIAGSFLLMATYFNMRPVPFELEGNCNTGFIGLDFQSTFKNRPYIPTRSNYNLTSYDTIYLPQVFNIKNIDNLNCNFKIKGQIPLNRIGGLK